MERYGWMIILAIIAGVALIGFFIFLFKDMEFVKKKKAKKTALLLNISLLAIAAGCIVLAVYLYFDIQTQLQILENI